MLTEKASEQILELIECELKAAVKTGFEKNSPNDIERKIIRHVDERIKGFVQNTSFDFGIKDRYKVKSSEIKINSSNGIVKGEIILELLEENNTYKYGPPGYAGNEDGEICQHTEFGDKYYKWDSFFKRWQDVTSSVCQTDNNTNPFNGFFSNSAFEPMWGNNSSGGEIFDSGRSGNTSDMFGNPSMRKPMGTFKQASSNILKSIYNFTLNLKSAISHYLKLEKALNSTNQKEIEKIIKNDSINTPKRLKIPIKLEKINHWSYFYNNGHLDQSGNKTIKDTMIYIEDIDKVYLKQKIKNANFKNNELLKFKRNR